MLRRSFIGGVAASVFIPRRVMAFELNNYNNIRDRVVKTIQREADNAKKYVKDDLKSWKPSEGFDEVIESCKNDSMLDELSYMKVMYDPPLKPYQQVWVGKKLLKMLESATTHEEAEFIVSIMRYYNLYSDE